MHTLKQWPFLGVDAVAVDVQVHLAPGLLVAIGGLTHDQVAPFVAMGELALDGACTPVPGALPAAMAALENNCGLICPARCSTGLMSA